MSYNYDWFNCRENKFYNIKKKKVRANTKINNSLFKFPVLNNIHCSLITNTLICRYALNSHYPTSLLIIVD